MLVAGSDESGRARAEYCGLAGDIHLQLTFADQEQDFLLMTMTVVRRAAGQEKHFVDVKVVAAVREAIEDGAKGGVRLFLGDQVIDAIGRRLQRGWPGTRLGNQQETEEG